MESVVGEQGLALEQHFPYKSSKFSENSNCRINLLFNSTGLKLDPFGNFDALFPFLAFFKLKPIIIL